MVLIVAKRYSRSRRLAKTILDLGPPTQTLTQQPKKVPPARTHASRVCAVLGLFAKVTATLFASE